MITRSRVEVYIPEISEPIDIIETSECESCYLVTETDNQGSKFLYP